MTKAFEMDGDVALLERKPQQFAYRQVQYRSVAVSRITRTQSAEGGVAMKAKRSGLWAARMILGGAIAGVAVVGVFGAVFGVQPHETHDLIGAVVGSGASAILLKIGHLI